MLSLKFSGRASWSCPEVIRIWSLKKRSSLEVQYLEGEDASRLHGKFRLPHGLPHLLLRKRFWYALLTSRDRVRVSKRTSRFFLKRPHGWSLLNPWGEPLTVRREVIRQKERCSIQQGQSTHSMKRAPGQDLTEKSGSSACSMGQGTSSDKYSFLLKLLRLRGLCTMTPPQLWQFHGQRDRHNPHSIKY